MGINHDGGSGRDSIRRETRRQRTMPPQKPPYRQDPVAVIGFANRLPGQSDNPSKLWELLERGGIAGNDPPESRWSLKGHFDGSRKPHTVRTPGAMFVENVDAADFDAGFFKISRADAVSLDPQQRQLLEVVYEGLENAGLSLEKLNGAAYGCFVGSYAVGMSLVNPSVMHSRRTAAYMCRRLSRHSDEGPRRPCRWHDHWCRTRYSQQQN